MREPIYAEYAKLIMDLIYFGEKARQVMARCDYKHLEKMIAILKFYAQFAKQKGRD